MTWFTYQDNNQRIGFEEGETKYVVIPSPNTNKLICKDGNGTTLWSYDLDACAYLGAVFIEDKLFIGDENGNIYCFDFSGNLIYKKSIVSSTSYSITVYSKPYLLINFAFGGIYKCDLDCNVIWSYVPQNLGIIGISCGYNSVGNIISSYSDSDYNGHLITLDENGNLVWDVDLSSFTASSPTIDHQDNIYIYSYVYLESYDSNGNKRFSYIGVYDYIHTPMVTNSHLLVTLGEQKAIACLDLNGNEIWVTQLNGFGEYSSPCKLGNDTFCFTTYSSENDVFRIYNVGSDGSVTWSVDLPKKSELCPDPASADKVYLSYVDSDNIGRFYIFDYNGNILYSESNSDGAIINISLSCLVEYVTIQLSETIPKPTDYQSEIVIGSSIELFESIPTLTDYPICVIPPFTITLQDNLPLLKYSCDIEQISHLFTLFGYDIYRKGRTSLQPINIYVSEYRGDLLILDNKLNLKYRVNVMGDTFTRASTVFFDKTFVVTASYNEEHGGISCVRNDGTILWSRVNNNLANASPSIKLLSENECLIVYSYVNKDDGNWYIVEIDQNGNVIKETIRGANYYETLSSPILLDKHIIHNSIIRIYKLDYDFNLIAECYIGLYILSCITLSNDRVYITKYSSQEDEFLFCLDLDLNIVWSIRASQGSSSVPMYYKGYVYVGANDKKFRKIDENGNVIWEFEVDEKFSYSSCAIDHSDRIIVPNRGYGIYYLNEDGNIIIYIENSIDTACKPTIDTINNMYYTGATQNNEGVVITYDPNGNEIQRYVNPSAIIFSSVTYEGLFPILLKCSKEILLKLSEKIISIVSPSKNKISLKDNIPILSEETTIKSLVIHLCESIPKLWSYIVFGCGHDELPILPIIIERGAIIEDWHHNNQVDALKKIVSKIVGKLIKIFEKCGYKI